MRAFLDTALGLSGSPNLWQMGMRALIIYVMSVVLIRSGSDKRLMGRHAPFDVILGVIFGSVMSRAVNGSAPFFQTIGAGAAFILIHWIMSSLAYRMPTIAFLLKGAPRPLIRDGELLRDNLKRSLISDGDLAEALRANGQRQDASQVKLAQLECNGEISVIPRN